MDDMQKRELRIMPPDLLVKVGAGALGMLALFLLVMTISQLKEYRFIGSGVAATNSITVSGQGEEFAVPDMGEFTVSVREEGDTVAVAQDKATKKANAIYDYLKDAGVEEKDIKTINYNVNPKYEWEEKICAPGTYCAPGKQTLAGFEVWQSFSVKVRDTKKAGDLLSGVGGKGASEVSSLSFTIDDEDAIKASARSKAIQQAEEKAQALASELGVTLVRVVGFYEDAGGYPMPYAYGRGGDMAMNAMAESKAVAPELPVGENKVVSNVNITYEIR